MRVVLWPELASDGTEQEAEAVALLARNDVVVLVAASPSGAGLVGFAEVGERAFADGCNTAPVAYLEGWYVDEGVRGRESGVL